MSKGVTATEYLQKLEDTFGFHLIPEGQGTPPSLSLFGISNQELSGLSHDQQLSHIAEEISNFHFFGFDADLL